MRAVLAFLILAGGLWAAMPASAADTARPRQAAAMSRIYDLPFPRSERAQNVWDSLSCWSDCGRQCAWGQRDCLRIDAQNLCIAWTDGCDRFCQRTCRRNAGPLLSITEF